MSSLDAVGRCNSTAIQPGGASEHVVSFSVCGHRSLLDEQSWKARKAGRRTSKQLVEARRWLGRARQSPHKRAREAAADELIVATLRGERDDDGV